MKPRRNTPIVLLSKNDLVGVALDVHGEEKSVFSRTCRGRFCRTTSSRDCSLFSKVLITAHQAFLTHEALAEIGRVTVTHVSAFASGQPFFPRKRV